MGNRAVIAFGEKRTDIGIYLHWNGGSDSVKAFLDAAKRLGVREDDDAYQPARLCQIIGNFMGGALSLGIGTLQTLDTDNGDNGVYVVDGKFNIVKRLHAPKAEHFNKEHYDGVLAETLAKNATHYSVDKAA